MGIHDRPYYGEYRRSPMGFRGQGSLADRIRNLSVNGWLIAINVTVFLIGNVFLANQTWDVTYPPAYFDTTTEAQKDAGRVFKNDGPQPIQNYPLPGYPIIAPDDTGRQEHIGYEPFRTMPALTAFGHFSTMQGFFRLEVWRLLTFQFLHANFMHIFFNMFGLWVFGGMVEQHLGKKRYLAFYLVCGIAGALAYLVLNLMGNFGISLPGAVPVHTTTPLVGASAGVFGVIMACARIAPEARIQLLFPPIPLKMKFFAFGYLALAAFNLIIGGQNQGGDAAHVGGALAGFYFIKNAHLLRDFFDVFGNSNLPARKPSRKRGPQAPSKSKVDKVLDKVSRSGIGSLSEKEKKILREASESER